MYGVNSLSELIKTPLKAGKHENVKIIEISAEVVGKDTKVKSLGFKIVFPDDVTHIHREFPVNRENIAKHIAKFKGATVEDVVRKEQIATSARIIHIMSSFVPQDKLIFTVNSWEEYIDKMVEIAGTAYESETFRCKVVFDKRGYSGFPKTTASPWFQNMKEIDTIVINPKWDNMVPPVNTSEKKLEAIEAQAELDSPSTLSVDDEELAF